MQSILGAPLTAGYTAAFTKAIAGNPNASQISDDVQSELTKSFSSAANTAQQYPQYSKQIVAAARTSFIDGADWAYVAGIVAVLLGATLVFFFFPTMRREKEMLQEYHDTDVAAHAAEVGSQTAPA
jgi:MFS transporter, DHA2 family, multidrug resistance protein